MAWLMIVSITLVSCDPQGHIIADLSSQNQAQDLTDYYATLGIDLDCSKMKSMMDKARAKVLQNKNIGRTTTRTELVDFLIQDGLSSGDIPIEAFIQEEADQLKTKMEEYSFSTKGNSIEPMIDAMIHKQDLTSADKSFMMDMDNQLKQFVNLTPNDIVSVMDQKILDLESNTTMSEDTKKAFSISLNLSKGLFCDGQSFNPQELVIGNTDEGTNTTATTVNTRCEFIECLITYEWVLAIEYVVLAIVGFILGFFTFGLTWYLTATLIVATWVLATVVTCWVVDCDDPICPDGQTPTCEGTMSFDESVRACTSSRFPSNAFEFGDCIYAPNNGSICPTGTTPAGVNCIWECFTVTPAQNSNDDWQIPYICQ